MLQIFEIKLQSPTGFETVLAICDSACSHSWILGKLAAKLLVQGTATYYLETDLEGTPIAVRLPLGWVLSGPLPSTCGLYCPSFRVVTQIGINFKLAEEIRSWYDMEWFGAYKQVHPRSASNTRRQKILKDTTYHEGCRYPVGMLQADIKSSLPNNYISALVQVKSPERRPDKKPELKNSYAQSMTSDLDSLHR